MDQYIHADLASYFKYTGSAGDNMSPALFVNFVGALATRNYTVKMKDHCDEVLSSDIHLIATVVPTLALMLASSAIFSHTKNELRVRGCTLSMKAIDILTPGTMGYNAMSKMRSSLVTYTYIPPSARDNVDELISQYIQISGYIYIYMWLYILKRERERYIYIYQHGFKIII
jgi:hypothetical protein